MDPVVISPTGRNPKLRRNGPSNVFERTISEIDKARTARSRRNIDFQLLLYYSRSTPGRSLSRIGIQLLPCILISSSVYQIVPGSKFH